MEASEILIRMLILLLPSIIGVFFIQNLINKKIETIWLYLSSIIVSFLSYSSLYIVFNAKEIIYEA